RIQLLHRQTQKQINPPAQGYKRVAKRARELLGSFAKIPGIWNSPVCGDWLARPHWADLRRRGIANRKNKIHLRRAGLREFIPTLAPQSFDRETSRFQLFQRESMPPSGGVA